MKLETKDIKIKFLENNLIILNSCKLNSKETVTTIAEQVVEIDEEFVDAIVENQSLNVINQVNNLDLNVYHFIPDDFQNVVVVEEVTEEVVNDDGTTEEVTEEVTTETQEEIYDFSQELLGNMLFSVPLDLTNIIKINENGEEVLTDYTLLGLDVLFQDCIYEYESDTQPLYIKNISRYKFCLQQVKDYSGQVYSPEWEFNGVGTVKQFDGYLLRARTTSEQLTPIIFKAKGKILKNMNTLSSYNVEYTNGWRYVAYKSFSPIDLVEFVSSYVGNNQIAIVKNTAAEIYWPSYYFNGIGNLMPGEAYQVKFINI